MRPISRRALGVATTAVLAVTAVSPSVATPPDAATAARPVTGGEAAGRQQGRPVTVTLVTGDRVLVSRDATGKAVAATALPREDGTTALVQTRLSGDDLYVYPDSAVAALAAHRADEQLFNVSGLIRQGYDDAQTKALPLIAVYDQAGARSLAPTPRGATRGPALPAVGGVALKADKAKAADFWADVTAPRSRAANSLKKLWLDRKVQANLDRSTKQVRADLAWAAGYDGKGTKVAVLTPASTPSIPTSRAGSSARRTSPTPTAPTTVRVTAPTRSPPSAAPTRAASGGKKKGVAPGAALLAGKVLNDSGSGAESWITAGMQWAVDNEADVVSMSLGSPEPTDCTDPMSTAAEQLAQTEGTLFVVAAGNSGPRQNTVSSPGCAPSVLTVGAVDRDDSTASFSSRGPAPVSHTLKPEIAAPARAYPPPARVAAASTRTGP
ncbi:S8 family serine peptidase [Streptomyces sp. NPDC058301]|uniref:S8 family serine peptidase n=1 Tax=Streptomyces sp. NPDC058301 TaxID=3346436 RepID=UPI0036EE2951